MFTPAGFGAHWRRLMRGFLDDAEALGAMLVKYEDLAGGAMPLDAIDSYLGIATHHGVMARNVRGTAKAGEKGHIHFLQRWLLAREVAPIARTLGYALR
jgi:hypothetical protein